MADSQDTIPITVECLCKAHKFEALITPEDLPLKASCCHCDSCRHFTGSLFACDVTWPGVFDDIRRSDLRRYGFSPHITILFCGTCSSPMFFHQTRPGKDEVFGAFSGVLSNPAVPNLVKIVDHIFLGDTLDGGASVWMRHKNQDGTTARRWKAGRDVSDDLGQDWPPVGDYVNANDKTGPNELPLWCHCKGVNFILRRGDAEFAAMDSQDLPWFVEPTNYKYLASFDACNSCRLSFGSNIVNWTFALLQHLDFPAGSHHQASTRPFPQTTEELKKAIMAKDRDPRLGTLALYESSPGVQRYFCSRCSASVFYAAEDRSEMVDVAIGLLESSSGARAEDFLVWGFGSDVGSKNDVAGGWRQQFVDAVQGEAEAWRIGRGYPKTWKRVAKETAAAVEATKAEAK
ncbi:hypothetical protein BGZ63DRAFT_386673 [Mariannaea sp. PMI_226]|nr:hypothetical protein BGZ63DRAFT_386673 [Mariannaea sp. PMI_226]